MFRNPFKWKRVRINALLVLAVYFSQNAALSHTAEVNFWKERAQSVQLASLLPMPANPPRLQSVDFAASLPRLRLANVPAAFQAVVGKLPYALGSVREINHPAAGPSDNVIVLVNDIHQNSEAQFNISAALKNLRENKKLDFIAMEGASGPLDVQEQRAFPRTDVVQNTADYFLETNKISGGVHAALTMVSAPPALLGVERPHLYKANVDSYLRAAPLMEPYSRRLRFQETNLRVIGRGKLNAKLFSFDWLVRGYHENEIPLGSYLERLSAYVPLNGELRLFLQAVHLENTIDFKRVEAERSAFLTRLAPRLSKEESASLFQYGVNYKLSSLSPNDFYQQLAGLAASKGVSLGNYSTLEKFMLYVRISDAVNGEAIFEQIKHAEEQAYRLYTKSTDEELIVRQLRFNRVLKKLVAFGLSASEWRDYLALKKKTVVPPYNLTDFEDFYRLADSRNEAMAKILTQRFSAKQPSVGALIVGGFHAAAISALLTKAGFTTISFVPKITKIPDGAANQYLSVFAQQKSPLEKLVLGEKLFLAHNPEAWLPVFNQVRGLLNEGRVDRRPVVREVESSPQGAVTCTARLALNTSAAGAAPKITALEQTAGWNAKSMALNLMAQFRLIPFSFQAALPWRAILVGLVLIPAALLVAFPLFSFCWSMVAPLSGAQIFNFTGWLLAFTGSAAIVTAVSYRGVPARMRRYAQAALVAGLLMGMQATGFAKEVGAPSYTAQIESQQKILEETRESLRGISKHPVILLENSPRFRIHEIYGESLARELDGQLNRFSSEYREKVVAMLKNPLTNAWDYHLTEEHLSEKNPNAVVMVEDLSAEQRARFAPSLKGLNPDSMVYIRQGTLYWVYPVRQMHHRKNWIPNLEAKAKEAEQRIAELNTESENIPLSPELPAEPEEALSLTREVKAYNELIQEFTDTITDIAKNPIAVNPEGAPYELDRTPLGPELKRLDPKVKASVIAMGWNYKTRTWVHLTREHLKAHADAPLHQIRPVKDLTPAIRAKHRLAFAEMGQKNLVYATKDDLYWVYQVVPLVNRADEELPLLKRKIERARQHIAKHETRIAELKKEAEQIASDPAISPDIAQDEPIVIDEPVVEEPASAPVVETPAVDQSALLPFVAASEEFLETLKQWAESIKTTLQNEMPAVPPAGVQKQAEQRVVKNHVPITVVKQVRVKQKNPATTVVRANKPKRTDAAVESRSNISNTVGIAFLIACAFSAISMAYLLLIGRKSKERATDILANFGTSQKRSGVGQIFGPAESLPEHNEKATGSVIRRDNGIEKINYELDDLAHYIRYRYRQSDNKLSRITTTNVRGDTTDKQSLQLRYKNGLLVGFSDRNRTFVGHFSDADPDGRPRKLVVTNILNQIRRILTIQYSDDKAHLSIYRGKRKVDKAVVSETEFIAPQDQFDAGLPPNLTDDLPTRDVDQKRLQRQIFNFAITGVSDIRDTTVREGDLFGKYFRHDAQGRPGQLTVKESKAGNLETKWLVVFKYLDNGQVEERIYHPRDVNQQPMTPIELLKEGYEPDEVRLYAAPPDSNNPMVRFLKEVRAPVFKRDGHTISRINKREYKIEVVSAPGLAPYDTEDDSGADGEYLFDDEDDLAPPVITGEPEAKSNNGQPQGTPKTLFADDLDDKSDEQAPPTNGGSGNGAQAAAAPAPVTNGETIRPDETALEKQSQSFAEMAFASVFPTVSNIYEWIMELPIFRMWEKSALIMSGYYVEFATLKQIRRGALIEEAKIHGGKLTRREWFWEQHQFGVPLIWLSGMVAAIGIVKVLMTILFLPAPLLARRLSLRAAVRIHLGFNYVWFFVFRPLEVIGKTILFEVSRTFGARVPLLRAALTFLIMATWFAPALASTDYRAQTARKELKFGIPEGPAVEAVRDGIKRAGMIEDPEFARGLEQDFDFFKRGYPVCGPYRDTARWDAAAEEINASRSMALAEDLWIASTEFQQSITKLQGIPVGRRRLPVPREWLDAEEREDLAANRTKERERGYEVGSDFHKVEIKDTEKIDRKKKSFEIWRDREDDLEKSRITGIPDYSILKKPHSARDQQYLYEWVQLTGDRPRRILIRYERAAYEEPEREGVAAEARLRVNLDWGVRYKLYDPKIHAEDFVADEAGYRLTYHGYLVKDRGTRIFEIKYPGRRPPLWVFELIQTVNSQNVDQVVWGGYSKYADSVVRAVGLPSSKNRLLGPGLEFETYLKENPEFDVRRKKVKDESKRVRISGLYDNAFADEQAPQRKSKKKKEEDTPSFVVKGDVPFGTGALAGAFNRNVGAAGEPATAAIVLGSGAPPITGPRMFNKFRSILIGMSRFGFKVALWTSPVVLYICWALYMYGGMPLNDFLAELMSGGFHRIDAGQIVAAMAGSYAAAAVLAWMYERTHLREDYNVVYPEVVKELAPLMAFTFLFLQNYLLLGIPLLILSVRFGNVTTDRAPSDGVFVLYSVFIGFFASVSPDIVSWFPLVLLLVLLAVIKFGRFWLVMNPRKDKQKPLYDYMLRLEHVGSNEAEDTRLLEVILSQYLKMSFKSDFVAPRPVKKNPTATIEFDLKDPKGKDPLKGGLIGFDTELRNNLSGKFLWNIVPRRSSRQSWIPSTPMKSQLRSWLLPFIGLILIGSTSSALASASLPPATLTTAIASQIAPQKHVQEKSLDAVRVQELAARLELFESTLDVRNLEFLLGGEEGLGLDGKTDGRRIESARLLEAAIKLNNHNKNVTTIVLSADWARPDRIEYLVKAFPATVLELVTDNQNQRYLTEFLEKYPGRIRLKTDSFKSLLPDNPDRVRRAVMGAA